jgi:hypothetical protein
MTFDPFAPDARAHILGADHSTFDIGLRRYMVRVYNLMAGGLGLTSVVSVAAVVSGFYQSIAGTALIWVVMLAPLAAVLLLSFRIERMSAGAAQATFWGFAAIPRPRRHPGMGRSKSGSRRRDDVTVAAGHPPQFYHPTFATTVLHGTFIAWA